MIQYTFKLSEETPSKKNNVKYSRNGTYKTKRFKEWHQRAKLEIIGQKYQNNITEPIDSPVCIYLSFTHGDFVKRDSDNGTSSIMDLLMDAGILLDDNWQIVRQIKVYNDYQKKNAHCEINIVSLDDIPTEE